MFQIQHVPQQDAHKKKIMMILMQMEVKSICIVSLSLSLSLSLSSFEKIYTMKIFKAYKFVNLAG
jgi:hypothetical protein